MHEHISESELARFATHPHSLPSSRRVEIENAVAECAVCRGTVNFLAVISDEDLADAGMNDLASWSGDDPMRLYVEQIASEDRDAEEFIAREQLLHSSMKTA